MVDHDHKDRLYLGPDLARFFCPQAKSVLITYKISFSFPSFLTSYFVSLQGVKEYERFLKCTGTLARCKVLMVKFVEIQHGFQPAMLHLLRKCAGIGKLVVQLRDSMVRTCIPIKKSLLLFR